MFSRLLLIFSLGLLSCAKPNYQNVVSGFVDGASDFSSCLLPLTKINQCAALTWIKEPTDSEMGVFTLDFSEAMLKDLSVILWMPSMGHGSRPTKVARLSETRFEVSNVAFIMRGEWEIQFKIKENNQVIDEVVQKITY